MHLLLYRILYKKNVDLNVNSTTVVVLTFVSHSFSFCSTGRRSRDYSQIFQDETLGTAVLVNLLQARCLPVTQPQCQSPDGINFMSHCRVSGHKWSDATEITSLKVDKFTEQFVHMGIARS